MATFTRGMQSQSAGRLWLLLTVPAVLLVGLFLALHGRRTPSASSCNGG